MIRRAALLAAAVATVLGAAACLPDSAHQAVFRFDEAAGPGATFSAPLNTGSGAVRVAVVTRSTGAVTATAGRGDGLSARFPTHSTSGSGPAAVIRVTNATGTDALDPGTGRLELAADVHLDARSDTPGSADDGDNVVQRGLYDDVTQYKVQVDGRRPMCRIKGRSGAVEVWATNAIDTDRWYRLTCVRDGNKVTLAVLRWNADGTTVTDTVSATGATGSLRPAAAGVPLSVGGKLTASGAISSLDDQFNGRIDDVRVRFG